MNDVVDNLVLAVKSGRTDIVRSVICACQSAEEQGESGDQLKTFLTSQLCEDGTLLHLACKLSEADIVRVLLAAGADTCVQNHNQKTPLEVTSDERVTQVFNQQLLQCISLSDVGGVCQLLAAGVSVNLRDSDVTRNTPLHWAASYGSQEVVASLCDRGAEVNACNSDHITPLHEAVSRGQLNIVDTLLTRGATESIHKYASPTSRYKGRSPLELAQEKGEELYKALMAKEHFVNSIMTEVGDKLVNGDAKYDQDNASMIPQVPNDLNGTNNNTKTSTANSNNVMNGVVEKDSQGVVTVVEAGEDGPSEIVVDESTEVIKEPTVQVENDESNSVPPTPTSPVAKTEDTTKCPLGDFVSFSDSTNGSSSSGDTEQALSYLWPRPQTLIERSGKPFTTKDILLVFVNAQATQATVKESLATWAHYMPAFYSLDLPLQLETLPSDLNIVVPHVLCDVNSILFSREESYRLSVSQDKIRIQCSDQKGLHNGVRTLLQLLRFSQPDGIPPVQIHDWPSLSCRGVLLDLSKGRVPHIDLLKNFICIFSQVKINQICVDCQLKKCMTKFSIMLNFCIGALLELDRFSTEFGVTLVPVLDITPKVTLADLDDLYHVFQHQLSCFATTSIVGVGPRLSNLLTDIGEDGELSLEDAHRFIPIMPHQHLQLCAYQFHAAVETLEQFPCNFMLAEYGFQSNYEFSKHSKNYETHGVPYCLMAGTAAWNSLAGCPEGAVANIHSAVQAAHSHNALGVLVSHWSGTSHVTPTCMIWPGIIAGAGLAWNSSISKEYIEHHVKDLTNKHVFGGEELLGHVVIELGKAETYLMKCSRGQFAGESKDLPAERGSTLHQLLTHPDTVDTQQLSIDHFQKTMRHIRKCQSDLSQSQMKDPVWLHVYQELSVCADLMMTACRLGRQLVAAGRNPSTAAGVPSINPGIANLTPTHRTDLANRLIAELESYKQSWLASNLERGLDDSCAALSKTLKQFVPDADPQK